MEDKLSNLEEIENWLKGEMSSNEKADFKIKLENDSKLKEEVEEVKALQLGIIHGNQKSIRDQLKGVEAELKSENFFDKKTEKTGKIVSLNERSSKRSFGSWFAIAASILFLIGAGSYLFISNSSITENNFNAQIAFENHYKPETKEVLHFLDRLEARGVSDSEKESKIELAAALSLYSEAKYKEALPQLKGILDKNPNDNIANLYMGLTLLEISNNETGTYILPTKILQHLQKAASDTSFQKADIAKWYLALCHIKTNTAKSKTDAKKLLQQLLNTDFKQDASKLLNTIK